MTVADDRRLAEVLRIMIPGDHLIAPGFLSFGRERALAQAEAAFHRLNGVGRHDR